MTEPIQRAAIGLLALLTLGSRPALAGTFSLEIVQAPGIGTVPGHTPSLGLDPMGRPHIAFQVGGALDFAVEEAGEWTVEHLAPSVANGRFSLDLDGSGQPAVAAEVGADVLLFEPSGGGWTGIPVSTGWEPDLHFDAAGRPAVAFVRGDDDLYIATRIDGAWSLEIVETDGHSGTPSLAFDGSGNPAIAYIHWGASGPQQVRLARRAGGIWASEPVGDGHDPVLAFESSGIPCVVYADAQLIYSRKPATIWTRRLLGASTNTIDFSLDPNGDPHITFVDNGDSDTKYIHRHSGTWSTETLLENSQPGGGTSITIDAQGFPRTALHDRDNDRLLYGTSVVTSGVRELPPERPGLALGPPHPNPGAVGGTLWLAVHLDAPERVSLQLLDVAGRLCATRPLEDMGGGEHAIEWRPGSVPSGVYWVRLVSESGRTARVQWVVR